MVEARGLRFHVEDRGSGPAVVLLHGWPDTSRLWRHQIDALTGAGYRTIAPDLRGRGRSERPPAVSDYMLREVVQDVTGILDALGVERAPVVGHDWGAAVAWLLASLAPERVERLVAISVGFPGAAGRPTLDALQKAWYRLLFLFEGVAEDLLQRDDWYLLRELLQTYPDVEAALAEFSEPGALTASLNWYRANLPVERLLAGAPSFPSVAAPVLGIWSTGDLYLTEHSMTRSAEFVSGPWRYERVEGAGHWIPLDRPEVLNSLLLEFLGG
ncbi:MAG: alpha/beta hydrolase [bacterium]|jgi:pimeloyl-ACP methyl ester carboxylesterase|nr:alpha/beta hydrolase [bacterium]